MWHCSVFFMSGISKIEQLKMCDRIAMMQKNVKTPERAIVGSPFREIQS